MNQFRFQREKRLLTAIQYREVFEKNSVFKDRDFLILVRKRLISKSDTAIELETARLGLAVSKKNFKRAVDRNLIKRVIRESFRLNQSALKGLDIVVMSRGTTRVSDKKALADSLSRHWEKIITLCGQF